MNTTILANYLEEYIMPGAAKCFNLEVLKASSGSQVSNSELFYENFPILRELIQMHIYLLKFDNYPNEDYEDSQKKEINKRYTSMVTVFSFQPHYRFVFPQGTQVETDPDPIMEPIMEEIEDPNVIKLIGLHHPHLAYGIKSALNLNILFSCIDDNDRIAKRIRFELRATTFKTLINLDKVRKSFRKYFVSYIRDLLPVRSAAMTNISNADHYFNLDNIQIDEDLILKSMQDYYLFIKELTQDEQYLMREWIALTINREKRAYIGPYYNGLYDKMFGLISDLQYNLFYQYFPVLRNLIDNHLYFANPYSPDYPNGDCYCGSTPEYANLRHNLMLFNLVLEIVDRENCGKKALELGIGLQSLNLPALLTVCILDEVYEYSHYVPFHIKWKMATTIKHKKLIST